MHQNNVLCDLFIGKGAGKKMLIELEEAKTSIKIISPYLSPSLIYKLIQLHKKGIKIHLVTTDAITENSQQYKGTFKRLITEKKVFNNKNKTLKSFISVISKIVWGLFLISIPLAFLLNKVSLVPSIYLIITILAILVFAIFSHIKLSNLKIYSFDYQSIFPLKLLIAPENANFPIKTFIHSKVYIIDDEIMYWGSLNFTTMGTQDNYETRIRTTDLESIQKMNSEFFSLMNSTKLPERKLFVWGQKIYQEQEFKL